MNGGTLLIDSPRRYSAVAAGLLAQLGIEPARLRRTDADPGFWARQRMGRGVFLDRETFGADFLAPDRRRPWTRAALRDAPLSRRCRTTSSGCTMRRSTTFPAFPLRRRRRCWRGPATAISWHASPRSDPAAIPFFQAMTHGEWGVGIDAVCALDVWAFGFPASRAWSLAPGPAPGMGYTAAGYADGGSDELPFSRWQCLDRQAAGPQSRPGRLPGRSAEDVVSPGPTIPALDEPRRRCASGWRAPCCGCAMPALGVEVSRYRRGDEVRRCGAAQVVLAC